MNADSAFPRSACSGESVKIPGVRKAVSPGVMDSKIPPREQIQCIIVIPPRPEEMDWWMP